MFEIMRVEIYVYYKQKGIDLTKEYNILSNSQVNINVSGREVGSWKKNIKERKKQYECNPAVGCASGLKENKKIVRGVKTFTVLEL